MHMRSREAMPDVLVGWQAVLDEFKAHLVGAATPSSAFADQRTLRHQPATASQHTAAKRIVGSHGIWQLRGLVFALTGKSEVVPDAAPCLALTG
ncbi:hypothetical protein CCMA1212_003326 [Trichoderma ghanense]|uniref:Uncharacterized protein n=1 Tax=Trichoderma ghanense TaxID=65468 RepID=A0ABY2H9H0_9HYPO